MEAAKSLFKQAAFTLRRVSIIKTLYYSLKYRSVIMMGKGSQLHVQRGGKLIITKGGILSLGLSYNAPGGAAIEIQSKATLQIRGRVQLMKGTSLRIIRGATCSIGDGTFINESSKVTCCTKIEIGEQCAISWGTSIIDSDMHNIIKNGETKPVQAPVVIGDHVWIGLGATILKGVSIGNNSIIGAGSIVTRSIPEHSLARGNPAKVVASDVNWDTRREQV
jgi:acetyltransferase-like isoleucine patch superfamily enzyme